MSRSNPHTPAPEQELERWQQQSESKFPPWAPRHRLHELPRLAAPNEAAASPTIEEGLPIRRPGFGSPWIDGEVTREEEPPADPEETLDEDVVLERFEDEGGATDPRDSGAETDPPYPRRGYEIVM